MRGHDRDSTGLSGHGDIPGPATRQSGRLYEIPLVFMGSTLFLALVFPYVAKPEHRWLMGPVLGIYGVVQLFLLWVVKGWGRMAALVAIGIEAVVWPWVSPPTQSYLVLSMPLLLLLGWCGDWWYRRRLAAEPPDSN
jgi:hypothetical protein